LPVENLWIGAGLNYQRRAELRIEQRAGMAGFSWGFGFNARALSLAYGRDTFHLAGSANHLTVTIRPDRFIKNTAQ